MNLILRLLPILLCSVASASSLPKLSPLTKKYLYEINKFQGEHPLLRNYVYTNHGNKNYIRAIIKTNSEFNDAALPSLGILTGTIAGNIRTLEIPLTNVEAFTKVSGIDYIQLDEPTCPDLFQARITTRVDSVHGGFNLPMIYNGQGVVMGVVDAGFDFGHPAYFDTTGTLYRVKSAWLQKNTTGTPPSGYSYGTEIIDSLSLVTIGNDNGQTHGTHVSGICGGSGFGSSNNGRQFRGIAYQSDFVLVGITPDKSQWVSTGAGDMIDGINYIFNYATSAGKPAVVNLSWGSPLGPRDGTGLFSQALDNLTGPGRIFVCSAGNTGEDSIHISKTFSSLDTLVQTFLRIAPNPEGKKTWVDIWGDSAKTFCAEVALFNNGEITSTGFVCLDDSIHNFYLPGINNDTCEISIMTSSSEFNFKPRILLDFDNRSSIDSICIRVKGNEGTIHFWNTFVSNTSGYYGAFKSYNYPWAVNGDHETTISDIASSISAITVGAYASKTSWTNVSLNTYTYNSYVTTGNLVPFSSHGPTIDGRIKPDITGPGLTIGSALSSYDTDYFSGGSGYLFVDQVYNHPISNRDYPYGELSGTSMSAPAVSGIAAMMLQIKSDLSPQEIKDIFDQTAINDAFTGTIVPGGNNFWGNGKVNAYGSVKTVAQLVAGVETIRKGTLACTIFPNPNTGVFAIDYNANRQEELTIEIFDFQGHRLMLQQWIAGRGSNYSTIDMTNLSNGIYFLKVSSVNDYAIMKIITSR